MDGGSSNHIRFGDNTSVRRKSSVIPAANVLGTTIRKNPRSNNDNNNQQPQQAQPDYDQQLQKKHRFFIWDYGALYLENTGSVARDHLASERTFLSWLRTSLAFASVGVGITQLLRLSENKIKEFGRPIGLLFLATAMITLVFGVVRYFTIQQLLTENIFPASRLFIAITLSLVLILTILIFVLVTISETS
ncbi:hypothetical protein PACTADRAFT_48071 [Pachysolen tannophilus NRRL Y-2460]|uniref:DUF202 domain-containing protein n=1 Tax=Pachysolen tannophilus NRRL Y-2460 TaxID=669874 RepID=A0A1E4U2Q0_PACTA|nr:hypothetical protein PACTADRAFT_48071 [Pachysolen tannophilus NRRL Y-2460]